MHIIGAGGHSKVIVDILNELDLEVTGIWDENAELNSFLNYKIRGDFRAFKDIDTDEVIIAIGNNEIRKNISLQLVKPTISSAVHPKSAVSKLAIFGVGIVVMANACINAGSVIGDHVIVNTNASIDHDCKIGAYVHVSPQAGLGGNVEVGEGTHIGIGASIKQGIRIGKWATVGAGAVIISDVPDYAVVVGNPGRIIKYNKI